MPFEFEDVSKKVADGSAAVKDSLDSLVGAAEKADKAHIQLSDTQKASIAISQKYSKAIDIQTKASLKLAKASVASVRAMSNISGVSKTVAGSLSGIAGSADKASDSLSSMEAPVKVASSVQEVGKAMEKTVKSSDKLEKSTKKLRSSSGKFVSTGKKSTETLKKHEKEAGKTSTAMDRLGESVDGLSDEVNKQVKVMDLLKSQYKEGKSEAEGFANGLGASSGVMVGAGVAAFYLGQKVADLVDQFTDAAVGLSKFNVQASQFAKSTIGVDTSGLENLRGELALTREQASEFYSVIQQGSVSGVTSVGELTAAARSLKEAFGGDPTERLKEYVELLETIPSIDTDLSITSNVDDQTESLFALAKAGKIQTVIDLQSAGLAGGIGVDVSSPEDVKMLNEAQKAAKAQEDIHDFLINKMFPSWGPHFSVVAKTALKSLAVVGGLAAAVGATSIFLNRGSKKQVAATKDVERAVWATAGGGGGDSTGLRRRSGVHQVKLLKRILKAYKTGGVRGAAQATVRGIGGRAAGKVFQKGGIKGLGNMFTAKAAKGVRMFSGNIGKAAKGVKLFSGGLWKSMSTIAKVGNIAGWVGIAMGLAGKAADMIGEKMEAGGNMIGGSLSKMNGAFLSAAGTTLTFAAAGAALGSVIPGLGTAVGFVVGAIVGAAVSLPKTFQKMGSAIENLGNAMSNNIDIVNENGETIKKYGPGMSAFGGALAESGANLKRFGTTVIETTAKNAKYIGRFWRDVGRDIHDFGAQLVEGAVYADGYADVLQTSRERMREVNASLKELAKSQSGYRDTLKKASDSNQASMLAFQNAIKGNEAAINSSKVQLSELRKEVAGIELGMFRELGGTAAQFNDAVSDAASSIERKFEVLGDALSKRRMDILKDSKLTRELRRAALDDLKKAELEATREFVEGMNEVIAGLLNTPEIISSGLKAQVSGQRIDFGSEAMGIDDFVNETNKGLGEIGSAISGTLDQFEEIEKSSKARRAALEDSAERLKQDFKDAFKTLPDEVKTKITGTLDIKESDIGNISVEQAKKGMSVLASEAKGLQDEIDKLDDSLPTGEFKEFMGAMKQNAIEAERAGKELKKAEKELAKISKNSKASVEERNEAQKKVTDLEAESQKWTDQRLKIQEEVEKSYKSLGLNEKELSVLMAVISGDSKAIKDASKNNAEAFKKVSEVLDKIPGLEEKSKKAIEDRLKLVEERAKLSQAEAAVEGLVTEAQDVALQELSEQLENEGKLLDQFNELNKKIEGIGDVNKKEVDAAKRRLGVLDSASAFETAIGNGLEDLANISDANLDVYDRTVETIEKQKVALGNAKGELDAVIAKQDELEKKYIANLIEGGATAEEAAKQAADRYASARAGIEKSKREIEVTAETLKKSADEASQALLEGTKQVETAITRAFEGFGGRAITAELDLADARFEFAEFSKDFTKVSREATDMAIRAAKDKAKLEAKAIEEGAYASLRNLDKLVEETKRRSLEAGDDPKVARQKALAVQAEGRKAIETEKQAKLERVKTEQVKAQSDAIAKSAELAVKSAQTRQDVVDAEIDFLSEIGGDFGRIFELQKDSIRIEQEKYNIAKEALDLEIATSGESEKTAQMERQLRIQGFNLQKKALGAQKSVYENLAGMAFGQIRSNAGAASFRTSSAGLLGRAGSRVRTRSGLFTGAGSGPTTIAGRSAQLQGARGAGPKRLSIDDKIEKGLRGNKDANDKTANATENMDKNSKSRGSLYTHDTHSESQLTFVNNWLKLIAEFTGKMAGMMDVLGEPVGEKEGQTTGEKILKAAKDANDKDKVLLNQTKKMTGVGDCCEEGPSVKKTEKILVGMSSNSEVQTKTMQMMAKDIPEAQNLRGLRSLQGLESLDPDTMVTEFAKSQEKIANKTDKNVADAGKELKKSSATMGELTKLEGKGPKLTLGTAASLASNRLEGKGPESRLGKGGAKLGQGISASGKLKAMHEQAFGKKKGASPGAAAGKGSAAESTSPQVMTGAESAKLAAEQRGVSTAGESAATSPSYEFEAGKAGFAAREASVAEVSAGPNRGGSEGGSSGGDVAFKFRGEIMVKFDNDMFKKQVALVVAESINNGDIRQTLLKAGYVNKNS